MKQSNRIWVWCSVFLCMLLIVGCEKENAKVTPSVSPTHQPVMETISIYTIDSDSMTLVPVLVKKEKSELTPIDIVSLVEDSLEDETVRVYSVNQEGKQVQVSFYADERPVANCSRKMEQLILDCFANSLLDNIKECDEIVFRCEDKAYKSKYNSFKVNDVYASK